MTRLSGAQLSHMGFLVRDMQAMIAFYGKVLGLVVTDRGPSRHGGEIVFLSATPNEHHQIVLVSGRSDERHITIVNQISFRVDSLEDVLACHAVLVAEQVKELAPRNHGNAWSVYFHDPEGNRLEVYTPTPWYVAQPYSKDLDLTEPIATIVARTEAMVRQDPTFCTREAWAARMAERLARH